jgi:hypothetical protein
MNLLHANLLRLSASDIRTMLRFPPSRYPSLWGPDRNRAPPDVLALERLLRMMGVYSDQENRK